MASKNKLSFEVLHQLLYGSGSQAEGERAAFAYLEQHAKDLIYAQVRKKGGSELLAERVFLETVQAVFQKIVQEEYDPKKAKLVTFLLGVANNKYLYFSRSQHNRRKHETQFLEQHQSPPRTPLDSEDFTDAQIQRMIRALVSLGEPCYTILNDYYLKGKKLRDIARELGISEAYAKKKKQRCLQKLKKLLNVK